MLTSGYINITCVYLCACVAVSVDRTGIFGTGSGPVVMSGVSCYWNDPSLIECDSYSDPAYCSNLDDAGVICEGTVLAVTFLFMHKDENMNALILSQHCSSLCNGF